MKKKYLILLLISSITLQGDEKYVIGAWYSGFFSTFFGVLNHLSWAKKNRKIPVVYWDKNCLYYVPEGFMGSNNAWEYYFEPVSSECYQEGDRLHTTFHDPDFNLITTITSPKEGYSCVLTEEHRKNVYTIINEFVRTKPYIKTIVTDFQLEHHMDTIFTVGIHLRGTDKGMEAEGIDPLVILETANAYVRDNNIVSYQFFVATDEERLLDLAKTVLNGKVLYTDAVRSTTNNALHYATEGVNRAQLGLEVLVEALLFASCDLFIHTCSNVSSAVLYFNPTLKSIFIF
jgi:hypothetical protein